MTRDKKQSLLIFLAIFICVLIFLSQSLRDSRIKKHFVFELNTWKGNAKCLDGSDSGCECHQNHDLWDCVGKGRDWSVVFVDHDPIPIGKRADQAQRMLAQCELMVLHDAEDGAHFPDDWCSKCGNRRKYTDQRFPLTQLLQGDLDTTGEIFDKTVALILAGKTEHIAKKFDPTEHWYGSHIKVLSAAALSTSGDVLEFGTGFFSTPMLHDIISTQGGRLLVSVDSDLTWLSKFLNLSSPSHQLVGLPVYEDGAGCRHYEGGSLTELDFAKLSVMGDVTNKLQSNRKIKCPDMFSVYN